MTTPNTQLGLTFTPEYDVLGAKPTKLMFNAHLSAPEVVEDTSKRSTISLTAVIDKSGSMDGEKLELVKRTCSFMLNQLSSQDMMGLVEYDSHVNELIPLSRTSEMFKTEAKNVIESMQAGTCTNLSGGLFKGVEQQQANTFVEWGTVPADPTDNAPAAAAQPQSPTSSQSSAETEDAGVNPVQQLALQNEADNAECSLPKPSKSLLHKFQSVAKRVMGTASKKKKSAVKQQAPAMPAQTLQVNRGRSMRSRRMRFDSEDGTPTKTMFDGRQPGPAIPVEDDALRSVFLFTDGLANEGITNTEKLVSALGSILDGTPRVRVYTFGFGEDHSPALLAELARVGAGTYYFMEKEESIPTAFADALGGLLSVAAQNVTVEFRPAAGVTVSAVHSGFGSTEGAGGARRIAVGDLLSEEGKDLLMEVALPAWEGEEGAGAELAVGTLAVSYLDVQGACLRRQEQACAVQRARIVPAGVGPNEGVALQRARVETAAGLAEARQAAESGDLVGARKHLEACLEQVEAVASASAFKAQLCQDLREAQTNMVDTRTYASRGSKLMWAKGKAHAEQRSACLSDSEGDSDDEEAQSRRAKTFSYANVQQKSMRKLAKSSMRSW